MAADADNPSGWTIDRVIIAPKAAVAALDEYERGRQLFNKRINDLIEANNRYLQDGRNWRIVERLRDREGNDITIVCDNPDFNGQPNNKVICNGGWTEWEDRQFFGETISEALGAALVAYNKAEH